MKTALNACLLLLLLLFTGCGSITSRWNGERSAYSGVRLDADCVAHPALGEEMMVPIAAIDLPLSAILDTFFLPYDLTGEDEQPVPSGPATGEAPANASGGYAR